MTNDKKTVKHFWSEIRLALRISHKNVCPTQDLHEEGRMLYSTMPYI